MWVATVKQKEDKKYLQIIKTLIFSFHIEQEDKVLIAFPDNLKYDYRPVKEQGDFHFSQEE